jgi:hypothetical protein
MHDRRVAMHDRQGRVMMGGCMMGRGKMPAASVSVEDVEGGSRLILRPRDPGSLEALRKHASECIERMQSGECPMMGARGAAPREAHPAGEK